MSLLKKTTLFVAVIVTLGMISCSSDDNGGSSTPTNMTTTFRATLTGANEVPSTPSLAAGSAILTFNNSTKVFSLTVNHTVESPTAGHVHRGAAGVSGPPVFAFSTLASPIVYTSTALDASQEADLNANLYYVNIHSAAYPDGEIRGQLIKDTSGNGGGVGY